MIALFGVGPCFLVNALSFVAMIVALRAMDPRAAAHAARLAAPRARRSCARRCATWRAPRRCVIPLAMMALVGTLAFNFQVLLPLLASFTWHGRPRPTPRSPSRWASARWSARWPPARAGAWPAAARRLRGRRSASPSCWSPPRPTLPLQLAALVPLGAVSVTFAAGVNSALQLAVEPAMRGRVMALYSIVFLGSTPIGAPLVGWIAEVAGPRGGLVLGGVAALVAPSAARWRSRARAPGGRPRSSA